MDVLAPVQAAWTSYTPAVVQSVGVTSTVGYAKYVQVGKTVYGNAWVSATSSGTSGQAITVSLPVAAATSTGVVVGSGLINAISVAYSCQLYLATSTTCYFINDASGANTVGGNPSVQVVSGWAFRYQFVYEAA